jgi:Ni,Fe-hydrogenase III small subunit
MSKSSFIEDLGLSKVGARITGIHKGVYINLPIPSCSDQDWPAEIIKGLNQQLQQTSQAQRPAKEQCLDED